jgi:hypothetical protein
MSPASIPYSTGTIEVTVELGVGNSATAGIWDSSAWDYAVWSDPATPGGDWVDVTCRASELDVAAGADLSAGMIMRVDGTTGVIRLHGTEWDPWAGTYPSNTLGPGVGARIRWRRPGESEWRAVFTGETDHWPYDPETQRVDVPVIDATGLLGNTKLAPAAVPVGAGDRISERINRVLDAAKWPATARDIPASGDQVRCVSSLLDGAPWALASTAADTDLGITWIRRDGRVGFRPVGQAGQWTPEPTGWCLTDTDAGHPEDICVINYGMSDANAIRNHVSIAHDLPAPDGGTSTPQTAANDASIARYRRRDYERLDMICDTDAWCATLAQSLLVGQAYPPRHPASAELDIRSDTRVADLLLGAEVAQTLDADVAGSEYHCVIAGWHFHLTRQELAGELTLNDVSRFDAGRWDDAQWDVDKWGI